LKNHIFRADRYLENDLALFGAVGLNDLIKEVRWGARNLIARYWAPTRMRV
jgi:hypothetical protein